MHPVIRVICFLLLSGFVVFGSVYELVLGLLIVGSVVLVKRFQSLELSLRIIKRMKWFFLSILVVYLWFTPGTPLVDFNLPGIPTLEGMRTGLLRILSLILIIFAVNYFVTAIARTKLVEAIIWLLYPVNWIGVDNRTVALRIALVLELIPKVQHIVLDIKQDYLEQSIESSKENINTNKSFVREKLSAASRLVEQLFIRVVDEAINMPHEKITLAASSNPPIIQWAFPVFLTGLFIWVKTL
jgi:energy-coupling factor transport system permease protein